MSYKGLLCIGDPHLSPRTPGHRRDDYSRAILKKLLWALDHARAEKLLPVLLGDLFHVPRDNGNALLVELLDSLAGREILSVVGNHDVGDTLRLEPADSLSILVAAKRLRLIAGTPWRGELGGRYALVGGSNYRDMLPARVERPHPDALVVWITHHDVKFRGYEEAGRFEPRAIEGVDVVVNGHIHRSLESAVAGETTWLNPGNIARVKRGEGSRRAPAVLRVDVTKAGWKSRAVEVPHEPYEAVFHAEEPAGGADAPGSAFVASMAALTARRTTDGQSLLDFLDANLARYPEAITVEIRKLASEVLSGAADRSSG